MQYSTSNLNQSLNNYDNNLFDELTGREWFKKDLFYLPQIEPLIKEQKAQNKQTYKKLVKEYADWSEHQHDKEIRQIDVDMNIQRLLEHDQKYIGMIRNRAKLSSSFESPVMHRIVHGKI